MYHFKNIHIGELICQKVKENQIDEARICNFLYCNEKEIAEMYSSKSLDTEILLRWSKLLEYDFFRIYSQHIILYSPSTRLDNKSLKMESALPRFRKNIYTKEIIDFILDLVTTGEKTKKQIVEEYSIPKTTLYKWIDKYSHHK
ncbi:hypothetical protein MUU74_08045 [Chryseobacterium daecheongense]|uniref:transposase n=1 Tax=Chryseobacterium daecheongense TaxID=192389 RepID=UPI001FD6C76D|nr:transposase [Chryseobacterium daecheongense]UOU99892.1 hypothetical protein MUU74_08045 [Chryseobacterium daecheongense]